jgi:undecaprenyl-diphosphatase
METFKIAVLGIVQGLTEFLPISSSAHLVLFPKFLGWQDPGLDVDAFLHLGTLFAVLFYFWDELRDIVFNPAKRKTLIAMTLATLPVVTVGFLAKSWFTDTEFIRSTAFIAYTLIGVAILMWLADNHLDKIPFAAKLPAWLNRQGNTTRSQDISELSLLTIFFIGSMQTLALFPGVSRSGITIVAGLLAGLKHSAAAKNAFLIGVPAIAGAGALAVKDLLEKFYLQAIASAATNIFADQQTLTASSDINMLGLGVGFITSFAFGWLAIHFLITFLEKRSLNVFVIYRIILGLFLLSPLESYF